MKVRHGFVSNSSTSSFLCDICGTIEAERDLCISEAGMAKCANDHTFCTSHDAAGFDFDADRSDEEKKKILLADPQWIEEVGKLDANPAGIDDLYEDWKSDARYELPPALCPICQLRQVPDELLILYLLKTMDQSREQIVEQISTQFDNYYDFTNFVKS